MTAPVTLRGEHDAPPLGLIFGTMVLLGSALVTLLHADHLGYTLCVFKLSTGFPCLTCGTTRALARLAHLDVRGALAMNPLTASAALAVLPWGVADLALLPRQRALRVSGRAPGRNPARVAVVALARLTWAYLVAAGR